jgi:septal ring factor EnvC (AmiA/AmiB activator)
MNNKFLDLRRSPLLKLLLFLFKTITPKDTRSMEEKALEKELKDKEKQVKEKNKEKKKLLKAQKKFKQKLEQQEKHTLELKAGLEKQVEFLNKLRQKEVKEDKELEKQLKSKHQTQKAAQAYTKYLQDCLDQGITPSRPITKKDRMNGSNASNNGFNGHKPKPKKKKN